jgi:hypothetical protein
MDTSTTAVQPIHYLGRDGKPMAETDVHIDVPIYLHEALKDYFRDEPQVYVAGNMLLYYEERNPADYGARRLRGTGGIQRGATGLQVVRTRPTAYRHFRNHLPQVTFGKSGHQVGTVRHTGVREYFLYDPLGEYLRPRCKATGCSRASTSACSLETRGNLSARRCAWSCGCKTGSYRSLIQQPARLLTPTEAHAARGTEAEARQVEAEARQAAKARAALAKAELKRLQEELARLQGKREHNGYDSQSEMHVNDHKGRSNRLRR